MNETPDNLKFFFDKCGMCPFNNSDYMTLFNSFKTNLKINSKILLYAPIYHFFTDNFKERLRLNSKWYLHFLKDKKERINYIGNKYKALLKNKKGQTKFKHIFLKEIKPLLNDQLRDLWDIDDIIFTPWGHTISKNIHDGWVNQETYLTYMTSKLKELFICPHFPEFYGIYFTLLNKVSYCFEPNESDAIKDAHHLAKKNSRFRILKDYKDRTVCEVQNTPVFLLSTEWISGDYFNEYGKTMEDHEVGSLLFSLFFTIYQYQKYLKGSHNDLHVSNLRYRRINDEFKFYKIRNKFYKIPTFYKELCIIDWGRGEYLHSENRIFSDDGEAYGMNYNSKLKGKSKKFKEFYDIGFSIMNIIDDLLLPDSIWKPELMKLLTTSNGRIISWKDLSIDFYQRFSEIDFQFTWDKIFNHPWFSFFEIQKNNIPPSSIIWG